jgi:hypothetical protein
MNTLTINNVEIEPILISCLQKRLSIHLNNKVIKKGKLILYKKIHYFIQFSLMSDKNIKENFDIPIPFNVENYSEEGILYFDYRLGSLPTRFLPKIPEKITSVFFDKIIEIKVD